MSGYLLDTNIISDLIRNPSGAAAQRIAQLGAKGICTSIVVAVDQAEPLSDDSAPGARKPTGVGHSIVAGPLGEVLLELGPGPELALIDLDLDSVAQARKALPVLGNSRFSSSLDR